MLAATSSNGPVGVSQLPELHLALFGTAHYESVLLNADHDEDAGSTDYATSLHTAVDQVPSWSGLGRDWDLRKLAGVAALAHLGAH